MNSFSFPFVAIISCTTGEQGKDSRNHNVKAPSRTKRGWNNCAWLFVQLLDNSGNSPSVKAFASFLTSFQWERDSVKIALAKSALPIARSPKEKEFCGAARRLSTVSPWKSIIETHISFPMEMVGTPKVAQVYVLLPLGQSVEYSRTEGRNVQKYFGGSSD